MQYRRRHHHLLRATITRRHFATKYTAKITSTSATGRSVTAEVTSPQPIPSDTRGYPIPRRHIICEATQLVQSRTSTSSLSDFFSALSPPLAPSEASEILKSLNCPRLAYNFFNFCPSFSPKFRHNAFTYNRLILIISKSILPDRFDLVRTLLADMERSNIRGNISTVNILIGFFGGSDDLKTCIGLVKKWDLKMNCFTYKCLLQAYLRSRDVHVALRVYSEMKTKGYKLDIFGYNMLLDALAKNEKVFSFLVLEFSLLSNYNFCDKLCGFLQLLMILVFVQIICSLCVCLCFGM